MMSLSPARFCAGAASETNRGRSPLEVSLRVPGDFAIAVAPLVNGGDGVIVDLALVDLALSDSADAGGDECVTRQLPMTKQRSAIGIAINAARFIGGDIKA
jgi:hypothetical protein